MENSGKFMGEFSYQILKRTTCICLISHFSWSLGPSYLCINLLNKTNGEVNDLYVVIKVDIYDASI